MNKPFIEQLYSTHQRCTKCPPTIAISTFFDELMGALFPDFANEPVSSLAEFETHIQKLRQDLERILYKNLFDDAVELKHVVNQFFDSIPLLYEKLGKDINATFEGDPAAQSKEEVIRCYPGFYAVSAYRIAHQLAKLGVKNLPRVITEHAHNKTGIDIHPNAQIGENFCIDHGTGVVIGETTIIGNNVKIYQGVTLGALSVNKEDAKIKRHPTIEDHVIIYAGATILGGNTIVGHNSIVGGNVWLTKSIPAFSKVYYQAKVSTDNKKEADLITFKI